MTKHHGHIKFARYADDIICHCNSLEEAEALMRSLENRMAECGLELHPKKSKVVYCADANRRNKFPVVKFDFLGYTFKPRTAINRNKQLFTSFSPAVGDKAAKAMRQKVRRLCLQRLSRYNLNQISARVNALLGGWVNYFKLFRPSAVRDALKSLNLHLVKWAQRKFKKLRGHKTRTWEWLNTVKEKSPHLFTHWSPNFK
mgnify:CR=1 FL=1